MNIKFIIIKSSHGLSLLVQSLPPLPLEIYLVWQPREDHGNTSPLLCRQGIATKKWRHHNAYKLAGCGDGSVSEGAKLAYGKKDEILSHCTTQAEEENVPCCFWMLLAELDCLKSSPMWPSKHVDHVVYGTP